MLRRRRTRQGCNYRPIQSSRAATEAVAYLLPAKFDSCSAYEFTTFSLRKGCAQRSYKGNQGREMTRDPISWPNSIQSLPER